MGMLLEDVVREELDRARTSPAGRGARTLVGGADAVLRQTVIAMRAGAALADHDNPGEATLHVLRGRVRLTTATSSTDGNSGELLAIPDERHGLEAIEDAAVLLTVAKRP